MESEGHNVLFQLRYVLTQWPCPSEKNHTSLGFLIDELGTAGIVINVQGCFHLLEKIYVKQPTHSRDSIFKNLDWVFFPFLLFFCAHNKVPKRLALVSITVANAFRSDWEREIPGAKKQTPLSACL